MEARGFAQLTVLLSYLFSLQNQLNADGRIWVENMEFGLKDTVGWGGWRGVSHLGEHPVAPVPLPSASLLAPECHPLSLRLLRVQQPLA